jgi:DNA-binding FadR family transcriptional regulator
VQRGNVGGAVVHRPQPAKAAFMLGMVLQSRRATLGDVLAAMVAFEPACAAACAARDDRATEVLPALRAVLDEANAAVDDAEEYARLARRFHVALVASCGNPAMSEVVGALEALWTAHVDTRTRGTADLGAFAHQAARRTTITEHEKLFRAIERGDVAGAERLAKAHYSQSGERGWGESLAAHQPIDAASLRDRGPAER